MDLTEGSIVGKLLKFTIPVMIIQFLNQAYTIVDNVIVARFVSDTALSVISTVTSAMMLGYCFNQGIGLAITILVGNIFGSKRYERLKAQIRSLLLVAALIAFVIFILYAAGASVILKWLRVPDEIMEESIWILRIYALSLPPTILCASATAALNGMGNSKRPMIISVSAQVLNIILDIIAVVILKAGIMGAAIASLISVLVAMFTTFKFLKEQLLGVTTEERRKELYCEMETEHGMEWDPEIMSQFLPLAIPSIIQQSILSIGNLCLQTLVNEAGIDYINGYNVGNTIFNFFILWIMSCCMGFETFAAQNYGAKNKLRVKQGFGTLWSMGLFLSIIVSLMSWAFASPLIGLYLEDSAKTSFQFARLYLLLLIPNYFVLLGKYSVDSLFKAQMRVYLFTISSFIALFVRILLGYALAPVYGLVALATATLIGNIVAMLFNWIMLFLSVKSPKIVNSRQILN